MVERLYVFSNFMDENGLSHAHDETGIVLSIFNSLLIKGKQGTGIVPSILNALLIKRKQGKLICFNVALIWSGKFAEQFSQLCPMKLAQHLMA